MHFEYFSQLFIILTFCRNVSAGSVLFTTELQLRVGSYESTTQLSTESVDVVLKLLESDWI